MNKWDSWKFTCDQLGYDSSNTAPDIIRDSTLLMKAAHGRVGALSAAWNGAVILPTHGYSDEVEGPLLVHEFTHIILERQGKPRSEELAYANQKLFEEAQEKP